MRPPICDKTAPPHLENPGSATGLHWGYIRVCLRGVSASTQGCGTSRMLQINRFCGCKLIFSSNWVYWEIYNIRCGSRIWSRGGPQLLRPKVADIAKRSRASEASILRPGSRARLRALEAFGFLMLKYAFSHILETLFLLFLTSILTPKVDK